MGMPFGWDRWRHELEEGDPQCPDCETKMGRRWYPILILMKEMAEALEEASHRMKPCHRGEKDVVNETLQKFKEWK